MPNRLSLENSPYLLQHQHNPVDWYPWGDEAFEKAKVLNLPLLVSIGYSACHWCHVMEKESFENIETAELMNRLFVNVKVDREERPDVDHIYMDAVQAISGSGGWPLNVFLTPEGKPFYGGTYFPPIKAYNRSSWPEVLQAIANVWQEKPHEILSQADNLTEHLQNTGKYNLSNANLNTFTKEVVEKATSQLLLMADKEWGGFGRAPKFPQTFSIRSLLRKSYFSNENTLLETSIEPSELLKQACLSLDKMIGGGLFDHLQGGFARYSTDNQWLVPHFEKMLYDNALLVTALSEAFQLTQNLQYKSAIEATLLFVQQEWQDSDGGFFSAFDADSEGEEGKFYVWDYDEVLQILGDNETVQRFCKYYDISSEGNWEGKNILWTPVPIATFAAQNHLDAAVLQVQFADCRAKLLSVRSQRVFPSLDNKKILAWNSYMIQACCSAWAALNNPVYLAMAEEAAHFIEEKLQDKSGGYYHNYTNGKPANPAFLDDLSAYCAANCMLHTCTGQAHYLVIAQQIMEKIVSDFSDDASPLFCFTSQHQKDIIIRKIEIYDGATASGNSVVADCLLRLGVLLNKPVWLQRATDMVAQVIPSLSKHPNGFANWLCVLQHFIYGNIEVAIIGEDHQKVAEGFLNRFFPNMLLQHTTAINENFPLLAGKTAGKEGETAIYVCKQYACQTPTTSFDIALQQIKSFQ